MDVRHAGFTKEVRINLGNAPFLSTNPANFKSVVETLTDVRLRLCQAGFNLRWMAELRIP